MFLNRPKSGHIYLRSWLAALLGLVLFTGCSWGAITPRSSGLKHSAVRTQQPNGRGQCLDQTDTFQPNPVPAGFRLFPPVRVSVTLVAADQPAPVLHSEGCQYNRPPPIQ